jgi:excisionase family DNA binding protein
VHNVAGGAAGADNVSPAASGQSRGRSLTPRFLQLSDVAEVLNISAAQTYALVRSGDLKAIKIGGRGHWRVEHAELENYIQRCYSETRAFVETHPLGAREEE